MPTNSPPPQDRATQLGDALQLLMQGETESDIFAVCLAMAADVAVDAPASVRTGLAAITRKTANIIESGRLPATLGPVQ
jgi:hypothetical protein